MFFNKSKDNLTFKTNKNIVVDIYNDLTIENKIKIIINTIKDKLQQKYDKSNNVNKLLQLNIDPTIKLAYDITNDIINIEEITFSYYDKLKITPRGVKLEIYNINESGYLLTYNNFEELIKEELLKSRKEENNELPKL